MESLREPAVSGLFYPADKGELLSALKTVFAKTKKVLQEKKVKALIVPHAGYIYSGKTAAWGYRQLPEEKKHFVLLGPSHQFPFSGLVCDTSNVWQTPLGKVKHLPLKKEVPDFFLDEKPHEKEHCLEVQLPFLQFLSPAKSGLYPDFLISCFLTGQAVNYKKTALYLLKNYPRSIFLISSDLSHYLPLEQAKKKDKNTIEAILNLESEYFLKTENAACGDQGILILLETAKTKGWKRKVVYYDTSATASADKNHVVGYCAIAFYV